MGKPDLKRKKLCDELKKNFEFHADSLLSYARDSSDAKLKNYLWRLIKDLNEYAYAKGYQTGRKTGHAEGIAFQFSKNSDEGKTREK